MGRPTEQPKRAAEEEEAAAVRRQGRQIEGRVLPPCYKPSGGTTFKMCVRE